ncbi:MAG: CAP domain-containing protein [Drouetiella hepatica Uher 2000/2452]|jgi:uncharacterized protein YkwD|uniref:CAP domain-containing protein n=1 Tax=Drouetiella hepatica Uher 2000/2452 TaxID=904376 RepID=A0A951UPP0_9CYAN|nr:CAP domain-containing protein [Drouetiella hepatica Uher 2000/2452]
MKLASDLKTASNPTTAARLSLNSGDRRTYRGQLEPSNLSRLYRIRCSQGDLSLSLTELKANASLTLLNSKGKTVGRSDRSGLSPESLTQTVEQGTYYVRVSGDRSSKYKLSLAIDSAQKSSGGQRAVSSNDFVQRVVDLTNAQRAQAGLPALKLNAKLSAAAYAHSRDMALNDFFNHMGSDRSKAADRVSAQGYSYLNVGENIAAGYATPEAVVAGWMNSPGHRANILYSKVKEIGVGFYFLANDSGQTPYQYYWTQDFATPGR